MQYLALCSCLYFQSRFIVKDSYHPQCQQLKQTEEGGSACASAVHEDGLLRIIYIFQVSMSQYLRKQIKKEHFPLHFSEIKFKTFFNNCILSALQARGFKQTNDDDWNIYWCEKEFLAETLDKIRLFPHKRVNHFRNWYEICRKDLLAKNIKRYKRQLEKDGNAQEAAGYDYTPLTYNLPSEYSIFFEEYKRASKAMWIMKPIGRSQGKGIFLFNKISDISEWADSSSQPEPYVVQRYIHNPLLVGNKKFDMRLYALVISHNPLTVYIYRSGFGRFTHMRYELEDTNTLESHLTNVAVQKNSDNYDEERGGKYFIDRLRDYLNSKYTVEKVDLCFYNIQELMIKTLIATCKLIVNDKKCFELYGYDVMIDATLKPWLIEINGSPSMSANTDEDAKLKKGLLDDVFTIVNLERIMSGEEKQIGGFDLVYKDGKRYEPNILEFNNNFNAFITAKKEYSLIGCLNNRQQNMRKHAKIRAIKMAEEFAKSTSQQTASISNNKNANNNSSSNTQRGRSMISGNIPPRAKPAPVNNLIKPVIEPGNSTYSTRKSSIDQGLKLPKVTSMSGSLKESMKSVKINQVVAPKAEGTMRPGTRESERSGR